MTYKSVESLGELIAELEKANAEMDKVREGMHELAEEANRDMKESLLANLDKERDRRVRDEMERLANGEISSKEFLDGPAGERLYDRQGEEYRAAFKEASEMSEDEFRAGVRAQGMEDEFPEVLIEPEPEDDADPEYDDRLRQSDRFKKPE